MKNPKRLLDFLDCDRQELNNVMDAVVNDGSISVFYGRIMDTNRGQEILPELQYAILNDELHGHISFQFTPYHIHLKVNTESEDFFKTVMGVFERYITRFTNYVREGKRDEKFDYALIFSLTKTDIAKGKKYSLILNNPTLMNKIDGRNIEILFQKEEILFDEDDIDINALRDEVELEEAEQELLDKEREQMEELDPFDKNGRFNSGF